MTGTTSALLGTSALLSRRPLYLPAMLYTFQQTIAGSTRPEAFHVLDENTEPLI